MPVNHLEEISDATEPVSFLEKGFDARHGNTIT